MTPENTTRLRALAEKATPGPWEADEDGHLIATGRVCRLIAGHPLYVGEGYEDADARFIAEMRNALPALLDEVERLRKLFDDAGQGEHNVLALVEHYQQRAMEADERAALAYPRALQAAAGVVEQHFTAWAEAEDHYTPDLEALGAEILALTHEDIARITQEHEHG